MSNSRAKGLILNFYSSYLQEGLRGFLSVRRHSSHPTNMFIERRICVGFYKVSETTGIEYRDLSDKIIYMCYHIITLLRQVKCV